MITRKTEYAIRALWELAQLGDGLMTANQVAQRQAIPAKYLPQIMSELTRAGLVSSARGFGGGLRIARDPSKISLLDIILAIQGDLRLYECQVSNVDCCHMPECDLRDIYSDAQAALEQVFGSRKLSQLRLGNTPTQSRK